MRRRRSRTWASILAAAVLAATLLPATSASAAPVTIVPGESWRATGGSVIQAHGGGMIKVGATYYWIGEDRANVTAIDAWDPSNYTPPFRNISCYSSTDLKNWSFAGNLLSLQSSGDLGPDRVVERPKVIYNAATAKYVLWMHIDDRTYAEAKVGVATSSSVCSGYTYHGSFRPLGQESRDMTVFADSDGAAYLVHSSDLNSKRRIVRLTSDYRGVDQQVAELPAGEAPAVFKKDATYYLVSSEATGWRSNDNFYSTAPSMSGPWTERGDFSPDSSNTYDSQSTFVVPVSGSAGTTYMYMGDRWDSSTRTSFGNSRYVWLPLAVNGTSVSTSYRSGWSIDASTGAFSTGTGGNQLISDDFEDGNADGWTTNGQPWSVVQPSGSSREYTATGSADSIATGGAADWSDYSVEAYVRVANTTGIAGVLGRVQSAGSFYQLELRTEAGVESWLITKLENGVWTRIASGPFDFSAGSYYLLKLTMAGSSLSAAVSSDYGQNLTVLGSGVDGSFRSGKVGMRAQGSGATFDVVRVVGF